VTVTGVVHQQTSLGVDFEVARRRIFIPANCMSAPSVGFANGEPAVLLVLRRFAEEEGLTPPAKSDRSGAELVRNTIQTSEKNKEQKTKARSRWHLRDRLVAMCVVEITAATQSGITSWKTKPCRLLLRLLTKGAAA
jgi:hypothetical protein